MSGLSLKTLNNSEPISLTILFGILSIHHNLLYQFHWLRGNLFGLKLAKSKRQIQVVCIMYTVLARQG